MKDFYHYSKTRESLFNWYDFETNAVLLEIGGECGALTGLFCRKCKSVITMVRTAEEADIVSKRYEKVSNLKIVISDNYSMSGIVGKFDYIVLPGTLEVMCGGSRSINPYTELLKEISLYLKDSGTILFSVNNRYGLKFFCGDVGDADDKPFYGLNRYSTGNRYTFSKKELEDIVKGISGFEYKFYYVLPDWKFTQLVYTDTMLPTKKITERLQSYSANQTSIVINEYKLYDDICDNNVFPFFSNSFLVECNRIGKFDEACCVTLSTDRGEQGYATKVCDRKVKKIALEKEGLKHLLKLKTNIDELSQRGICTVSHELIDNYIEMDNVTYKSLSEVLKDTVKVNADRFIEYFDILYEQILKSSDTVLFNDINEDLREFDITEAECGPILKKAYIDMIPINCFCNDRQLIFYDQEFVFENFPVSFVMFRALKYTYQFMAFANEIVSLDDMKKHFSISNEMWECYKKIEAEFVANNRNYSEYRDFTVQSKRNAKVIKQNIDRLSGK